jgi:hypothetical protein
MPIAVFHRKTLIRIFLVSAVLHAFSPDALYAADTIEVFNPGGFTDFEFYLSYGGIGLPKEERAATPEWLAGASLTDSLSTYIAGSYSFSEAFFALGQVGVNLGVFGTPIDTDHFDLDLMFDVGFLGATTSSFIFTPGIELNYDTSPDMDGFGLYLRLEPGWSNEKTEAPSALTTIRSDTESEEIVDGAWCGTLDSEQTLIVATTPAFYWVFLPDQQFLAEFNFHWQASADQGERLIHIGGLTLGYNLTINDSIELINQVFFDFPQETEDFSIALTVGAIFSFN